MNADLREGTMELWISVFKRILGRPTESISLIDLCCGPMGNTRLLTFRKSLHVDVKDYDERPRQYEFMLHDVLTLPESFDGQYDVALCSDGIEHFSKVVGYRLIERMMSLSKKQVIFTPLGDYMVDPNSTIPESHKSGWLAEDFPPYFETQEFPNWHPTLGIGGLWAWHSN